MAQVTGPYSIAVSFVRLDTTLSGPIWWFSLNTV